ncbi:hypothetical protein DSCW_24790 [Desulfosarcina widdelii]|uniref:Uncharacterized protein n=1 Tax=Desulfosarcina widdelii TaxID=947919 RepID=A0A5K7YZA9_9BACT|nr:hypothetical protein DSCW_24790 [Desulfosarcina widdelii]
MVPVAAPVAADNSAMAVPLNPLREKSRVAAARIAFLLDMWYLSDKKPTERSVGFSY